MNMISIKQKKNTKEVEIIKNNNFNITKDIILYEEFEKKIEIEKIIVLN